VCSILFQRGVYDAASFGRAVRWGLSLQVTADPQLTDYLNGVLAQVKAWLEKGEVKKLVLILAHRDTEEVMERSVPATPDTCTATTQPTLPHLSPRLVPSAACQVGVQRRDGSQGRLWEGNVSPCFTSSLSSTRPHSLTHPHPRPLCRVSSVAARSDKEVAGEIGAILRQITSSTSFLPLLDCLCTFDVLVYTPNDIATPGLWEESDARVIPQSAEVHLRSFTTRLHKINTSVAYKLVDFGEA
jgi:hypothetical protein